MLGVCSNEGSWEVECPVILYTYVPVAVSSLFCFLSFIVVADALEPMAFYFVSAHFGRLHWSKPSAVWSDNRTLHVTYRQI